MRKRNKKVTGFDIALYTIFGILGLLTLYPFYYVVIVSFANTQASAMYTPYLYPHVFDLTGYKMIIGDVYFFKSVMTTLFVTLVGTTLNMVISVMTAYVLSRKRLVGRKQIILFITFTMLFSGGLIPTYLVVSNLGLTNSIWSMIFPGMISTYYVIIMKNYFSGLPQSLEDAAKIDGANAVQTFFKITLPYMLFVMTPYLITQFTGNINNFNVIFLLSGGNPTPVDATAGKTDLLVTWLYKLTVDKNYYNLGAVIGIMTFIVLAIVALVTYRNTASYKDEEGFM